MDIFKIPGFIVAVLTLYATLKSGKNNIQRNLLITVLKMILESIFLVLFFLTLIYFISNDFKAYKSFTEFIFHFAIISSPIVFLSIVVVQLLFPIFERTKFSIKKYGEGVSVESNSWYDNDFYIEILYFVKEIKHVFKYYILIYIFRLLLISSIAMIFLVFFQNFQNYSENNLNYPYIANEKIFIKNTEPIEKTFVKDGKLQKEFLPKGTIFSISKGSRFFLDRFQVTEEVNDVEDEIRDEVYGLMVNDRILVSEDTKIYYEGELDHIIFLRNYEGKISNYNTVKTVPGETYFKKGSRMVFRVTSSPNESTKSYYKFIVESSTENNLQERFLENWTILISVVILISVFILLFLLPKYLYLSVLGLINFFEILFIFINLIKINLLWLIVSVTFLIISWIEIFSYATFLNKNIIINRIKSLELISVKINKHGTEVLFDRGNQKLIDIAITDKLDVYNEKFKYFVNGQEQKEELRVIVSNSVKFILFLYFRKYNIIVQCIRFLIKFFFKK